MTLDALPKLKAEDFDFANMPPEILAPIRRRALAKMARGEGVPAVAAFGELVFGRRPAKHHLEWIAEILGGPRTCIVAPPESAKSTWVCVILVAWWIGKHPETTNLIVSVGDSQANKMAANVARTIEHNSRWKEVFPHVVKDEAVGWGQEKGYYVKRTDIEYGQWVADTADRTYPTLAAGGVGSSQIIGMRVSGILACDDMHDDSHQRSEAKRETVISFFKTTVSSRATETGKIVVVGTRWHPKDVINYIKNLGLYAVFEHPATDQRIYGRIQAWWNGREEATSEEIAAEADSIIVDFGLELSSYWPEVYGAARLIFKFRELGSIMFALMFMGDEKAALGRLLKLEWLRYYPHEEIDPSWPRVFGIDPAFRKLQMVATNTRKRSRFAMHSWVLGPSKIIIEDVIAEHITEPEAEARIEHEFDKIKPVRMRIETNGVGDPFYQTLLTRTLLPLEYENVSEDVVAHAQLMARDFEFGRIWVSDKKTPGLVLFAEEWLTLGDVGASDDTISAAYLAWRCAQYTLPSHRQTENQKPLYHSPFTALERYYYGK